MAQLTAEQKQAVSEWAEAGVTLNEVQSRLKSEFGLSMTYMEARLLMMEMEVRLKDKHQAPPASAPTAAASPVDSDDASEAVVDAFYDDEKEETAVAPQDGELSPEAGTAFSMEADELMVPGTLVSGRATFSDGMKAKWFLDQMGRLSLKADQPGYQPPAADVPKFQQGLEKILIKLGLY